MAVQAAQRAINHKKTGILTSSAPPMVLRGGAESLRKNNVIFPKGKTPSRKQIVPMSEASSDDSSDESSEDESSSYDDALSEEDAWPMPNFPSVGEKMMCQHIICRLSSA